MTSHIIERCDTVAASTPPAVARLRNYYLLRAAVAAAWVAAAFTVGQRLPLAAAALLIAYPAWDALANLLDAARSGGIARDGPQALNAAVSGITAVAIAAVIADAHAVLAIFGVWAIVAGLLQLATGVRRRRLAGGQWAMMLSGTQSALAGGFFIRQALTSATPGVIDVAPYAAFGAFYFAASGLWLLVRPRA